MQLSHLAYEFQPESLLTKMLIQGAIEHLAREKEESPDDIEVDQDVLVRLYQLVCSNREVMDAVMKEFGGLVIMGGQDPQQEAANLIQAKF